MGVLLHRAAPVATGLELDTFEKAACHPLGRDLLQPEPLVQERIQKSRSTLTYTKLVDPSSFSSSRLQNLAKGLYVPAFQVLNPTAWAPQI